MDHKRKAVVIFEKWKIPLLVLTFGVILMLLPGPSKNEDKQTDPEVKLQELLCRTKGVGPARVLISDSGVVIVCAGAEDPRVRLDIIRAVGSYTGFGSDKITILKLAETG